MEELARNGTPTLFFSKETVGATKESNKANNSSFFAESHF